ncbi:CBS domain-containing protein [Marinomonas epiphytica]
MKINDIMSSPVVTVELDDSLAVVDEIFRNTHFHHLLVVEDSKLLGVLSDRDLLKALSPKLGTAAEKDSDLATLNKKVHQIMSRKPICIGKMDSLYKAVDLLLDNKISCLPVLDEQQKLVGIISWRDLLRAIKRPEQSKKTQEFCEDDLNDQALDAQTTENLT